jgi:hypothetical protein
MGQMIQDSGWRIPDDLWEQMVPLLPSRPSHPLGEHGEVWEIGVDWGAIGG